MPWAKQNVIIRTCRPAYIRRSNRTVPTFIRSTTNMPVDFETLAAEFNKNDAYEFLIELDLKLAQSSDSEPVDHGVVFRQLTRLINVFCDTKPEEIEKGKSKQQGQSNPVSPEVAGQFSYSLFSLLSRTLVTVLAALPNKVYDTANNLLRHITVDEFGNLSLSGLVASIILIDVFEQFPHHVSSLINFAATQLYKILKKNTCVDCNVAYLLNSVLKSALKSDIDEKFQAKWIKLLQKAITQTPIEVPGFGSETAYEGENTSIAVVEYYILSMKSLLILQAASNYQHLVDVSTSSSGPKMKAEAVLSLQNQFQIALLASHEKFFQFGFQSQFKGIRAAMVDLVANVLFNFVETGKFNPIDYLVELYPMPDLNLWDLQLTSRLSFAGDNFFETRRDSTTAVVHDSQSVIRSNAEMLLLQIGCVEALVVYIQIVSLQDWDFFPSYICKILDSILVKFGDLSLQGHIQNQQWIRTLDHWSNVVKFLIEEGGSTVHEILATYVVQRLASSQDTTDSSEEVNLAAQSKASKRQSLIFSFKSARKNKTRGPSNTSITPFHNPYQMNLILLVLEFLFPYGVNFESLTHTDSSQDSSGNESGNESDQDSAPAEQKDDNSLKRNKYISDLLLSLICNENEYIRNYSLSTLLRYAKVNFSESNQLTLTVFLTVSQLFSGLEISKEASGWANQRNTTKSTQTKLLAHSLALLALLKQSDTTVLQNSTIAKILSFCTQNLKHNSSTPKKTLQNASCWIVLSAIVTYYPDSEFVKLNSSQFLVFWKSLLTSQFITSDIALSSEDGLLHEIINNLKLRALSIVCLLNYISSVTMSTDLSKQLQFLLVKAHKYLIYLESNLATIGEVTSFHPHQFNESEYNPNMINNIIFSNFNDSKSLSVENQLISLILYNKKVILQGFLRLSNTLKSDVNSSLVVLLFKIFADPKVFSRTEHPEVIKDKNKPVKSKLVSSAPLHNLKTLFLLDDERYYNFGVTSKFNSSSACIDELNSKFATNENQSVEECKFSISLVNNKLFSNKLGVDNCWNDVFENGIILPLSHSVNHDPISVLQPAYSTRNEHLVNLITSLVDLSIEVFQGVFPSLSFKIQFSLLEQLMAAVSAQNCDPLRKKALQINISIALNGVIKNLIKTDGSLNEELVTILIHTVEEVLYSMCSLVDISADTIGWAATLLSKEKCEEIVSRYVNEIVNKTDPFGRGVLLLSLSRICQHAQVGLSKTFNVISQLIVDPHPVVTYYSIYAAANIMENCIGNNSLSKSFIEMIHSKIMSTSCELSFSKSVAPNLLSTFNVMERITHLFKLCITSLGPTLKDSKAVLKQQIKQMVISIPYGIGCSNMSDCVSSLSNILGIFQELLIFDSDLFLGLPQWCHNLCNQVIKSNMKVGVGVLSPTSINTSAVFPLTTSQTLYDEAYSCIVTMTKLGFPTLNKESLSLAWISMELCPSSSLRELISFWIDSQAEVKWFSHLSTLFKLSRKKLVGTFVSTNYQHKLSPSLQRRKKSVGNEIMFEDEEAQNIVSEDAETEEKNEQINWDFKIFVYAMLVKLMADAEANESMTAALIPKIQEIVRLSFVGTTSPILKIKLKCVELLDRTLSVFGEMGDPLYPSVSILEQQQAQIISALIPCFGDDSDANVMVHAINVSSKFVNLPRIKFYSKQRILKTLAILLEEISSNKFIKFAFLEDMAEYGKKAIQLAILNCWAVLRINLEEKEGLLEPEFQSIFDKYSVLLTSLWILALKDLSAAKYSLPNSKEIKLYSTYWLNFVGVLSLELEKNHQAISDVLKEEEADFFFVLFCQCAESLIKKQSVSQVLASVNRLLQVKDLVYSLFKNAIFGEIIDLVDRLILMDDDSEVKCQVLETVKILFVSFASKSESWAEADDPKLLELLRVAMLPLFQVYPFLRQDFSPEDASHKLELSRCKNFFQVSLLQKLLSVVITMIHSFSNLEEKEGLLSCLLYIFAKFYDYGDEYLVGKIIPYLKTVIDECFSLSGLTLPSRFLNILRSNKVSTIGGSEINFILTYMVLVTAGGVELNLEEVEEYSDVLVNSISNADAASTAIQSIKSLIRTLKPRPSSSSMVVKGIMTRLLKGLTHSEELLIDKKIALEIVYLISQSEAIDSEEKKVTIFSILVSFIAKFEESRAMDRAYLRERIISLLNSSLEAFKVVVNDRIDERQKQIVEDLIKSGQIKESGVSPDEDGIELKIFG